MKKKIFITGISSLIMRKVCDLIDLSEYEIIGISRTPSTLPNNNITIIHADISNLKEYEDHLKDCELVIHAASVTHSFNEERYYDINFGATKKLVDKALQSHVKKFVYISSNTASKESGAYAHSKLLAEDYIKENLKHWLILRPSEFFGEGCEGGLESLIKKAINKSFVICPKGMPYSFSPIYINDAAQMIFESIFAESYNNEIEVVGSHKKITFQEIIRLIKEIRNKDLYVFYIGKKKMFFIKKIAAILPFRMGVIPDQIERLYGFKSYNTDTNYSTLNIEDYIKRV